MKRKMWIALVLGLILGLVCCTVAKAGITTGECGNNVHWQIDSDTGVLSINGSGAMTDYPVSGSNRSPFETNYSIKSIVISEGITHIGSYAFESCGNVTAISLPSSIRSLGECAFLYCKKLTSITIPYGVDSIRRSLFNHCTSLVQINIPSSVITIDEWAFSSCTSLEQIVIPDSVTSIGCAAFNACSSLKRITIPYGVSAIEDNTFTDCTSLSSVVIPASVTSIGRYSFLRCQNLTTITIPSSVTSIHERAFNECDALMSFTVDPMNANYASEDGLLLSKNRKTLLVYPCGKIDGSLTLPYGIETIGPAVFYNCAGLTSLTIPDTVTVIEEEAFWKCTNLTQIILSNNLTSVGKYAFSECGVLSLSIPGSLRTYGEYAFANCKRLLSLVFQNGIDRIGGHSFWCCSSLSDITFPSSLREIEQCAFDQCTSLGHVSFPDGLQRINGNAFSSCEQLREITLPESVSRIGIGAFYDCPNLLNAIILNRQMNIDSLAFSKCPQLTIIGYLGSTAESFANDNGVPFSPYLIFHISFDANGGSGNMPDESTVNSCLIELPECTFSPPDSTYYFSGWKTETSAILYPGDTVRITKDTCFLAQWEKHVYTISFDNCNHGLTPDVQHVPEGETVMQPETPTAYGWVFGGWYTDTDFAPAHKYHFTEPVTANLTLYAWWGHSVDFDPNGRGPNNFPVSRKEVHEGSPVAMPDVYTLRTDSDTWQGWYIEGWYRESECVNRFDFAQPVTANIRLYAHWLYDGYTVTYNWNGIHNVTRWRPADGTYSDIEPDTPVELKTRTGQPFRQIVPLRYTGSGNPGSISFTGWYTEPECVNLYDFSAAATGDTTLYAGWANNYTVTRHYTNPSGGMVSTFTYIIPYNCVPSDDSFLSYALEDPPHYNGWVMTGYFTDEALTVPFNPDVPLTADVDIYIKWEKASYTVTFDMNGGNEENIIQTYAYGDAIIPPTTRPTRTEYVFEGWSPYANATYTYGFANTTCTGDATYYAVWVPEGIAINAANFPDEVFRHYVLQNIATEGHTDANGTHYLSASERDDVTTLDLRYYTYNGQKISNLQGIQYFTKLETLQCQNHNLTALDLSHNTELKTLECQENQITSLNLNNNTKLTTLNARGNALTNVNAVKCTELTGTVYLYNNPDLTSVQLSAPGIRVLELQFTGVTEIDLSGCPNLCLAISNGQVATVGNEPNTYERHLIHLNNVNYIVYLSHGTPLNGFITSGIPIDEAHFPDAAFREFMGRINFDRNQNGVLTDNEISEITVLSTTWAGSVTGMHSLQGIEYLTSVAEIRLDGSGLDEVDLSQNQHLHFVSMKNNDLRSVDVSALSGLTGLDLSNNPGLNSITTGSVQIETLRAPGAPLLTGLDLSGQLRLLKTYLDGNRVQDGENVTYTYTWNAGLQTQRITTLVLHQNATVVLPEWEWDGTERAVFVLPNGTEVSGTIRREISGDGRSVIYTATATVSGVPFTDSRSFCLITFADADVPAQELNAGDYADWPADPFMAGSIFDGWYLDSDYSTPCTFADPVTEGFTVYAKWITPTVSGFLKLPAATGTIESEAFYGIPAEAVIIPASVNSIAYDAFHHSGVQYIYGFPGTRAESFADAYGYTFVPISNGWLTSH